MLQMTVAALSRLSPIALGGACMPGFSGGRSGWAPKRRKSMSDPNTEKNEMRVMWIGSAAIVLLILAAMGINMLIAHGTSTGSAQTSSQSAAVPPK
jgi:hypothetical protein